MPAADAADTADTDATLLAVLRHLESALAAPATLAAPGGGLDTLPEEDERLAEEDSEKIMQTTSELEDEFEQQKQDLEKFVQDNITAQTSQKKDDILARFNQLRDKVTRTGELVRRMMHKIIMNPDLPGESIRPYFAKNTYYSHENVERQTRALYEQLCVFLRVIPQPKEEVRRQPHPKEVVRRQPNPKHDAKAHDSGSALDQTEKELQLAESEFDKEKQAFQKYIVDVIKRIESRSQEQSNAKKIQVIHEIEQFKKKLITKAQKTRLLSDKWLLLVLEHLHSSAHALFQTRVAKMKAILTKQQQLDAMVVLLHTTNFALLKILAPNNTLYEYINTVTEDDLRRHERRDPEEHEPEHDQTVELHEHDADIDRDATLEQLQQAAVHEDQILMQLVKELEAAVPSDADAARQFDDKISYEQYKDELKSKTWVLTEKVLRQSSITRAAYTRLLQHDQCTAEDRAKYETRMQHISIKTYNHMCAKNFAKIFAVFERDQPRFKHKQQPSQATEIEDDRFELPGDTQDMMQTFKSKERALFDMLEKLCNDDLPQFFDAINVFDRRAKPIKDELLATFRTLKRQINATENMPARTKKRIMDELHTYSNLLETDTFDVLKEVYHKIEHEQLEKNDPQTSNLAADQITATATALPPAAFGPHIAYFARSVCALAFPPAHAEPWAARAKHAARAKRASERNARRLPPPSPFLVLLCARVAHIAAVAQRNDALGALRFALEITPASPLVARALAPAPSAALEHPNIHALRACFRAATLLPLHAFAARNSAPLARRANHAHHAYHKRAPVSRPPGLDTVAEAPPDDAGQALVCI
jgi:hypothetical protein